MKAQDILVAIKLLRPPGWSRLSPADKASSERAPFAVLGAALGLAASDVHRAHLRCINSGLVSQDGSATNPAALLEFLVHGAKYVWPPKRGGMARGMPTAHSASPLESVIVGDGVDVVWPDPEGTVRGLSLKPIHKAVPTAARNDDRLYQTLALLDAIRAGRAREREIGVKMLRALINGSK